jgi:hypothetical protein
MLGEFGYCRELVGIGWSHRQAGDHSRLADPRVYPKAIEGLLEKGVPAESGFSFKALAAVGSGEQARRQRHRVADGESGLVRDDCHELLPEEFLEMPEVGTLASEGSAVNLTQGREPLSEMNLEVLEDSFVGVEAEELPDDFDGEGLRVGELWGGATRSEGSVFDLVVYEAEDGYDEAAKIHEKTSCVLGAIWFNHRG